MSTGKLRANFDQDIDAAVKTSHGTRGHMRTLALINVAALFVLLGLGTMLYLRVGRLPELAGQAERLTRIDLELMLFKGYSASQLFLEPTSTSKNCRWLRNNSCGATYELSGSRSYRCLIEPDRGGNCFETIYTCRQFSC